MPLALALVVLLVSTSPAAGQAPVVTADAFEALAEGRSLYFSRGGERFGAEQFFPGRRSLWRSGDDACAAGRWFGEGEAICFTYDSAPEPVCWRLERHGTGFTARALSKGVPTSFALVLDHIDTVPLSCPGPRVGS